MRATWRWWGKGVEVCGAGEIVNKGIEGKRQIDTIMKTEYWERNKMCAGSFDCVQKNMISMGMCDRSIS